MLTLSQLYVYRICSWLDDDWREDPDDWREDPDDWREDPDDWREDPDDWREDPDDWREARLWGLKHSLFFAETIVHFVEKLIY